MNWKILYKYVEGTCSEKELEQLAFWLEESPANEDFFKTFIEQSDEQEIVDFEADVQVAWEKFKDGQEHFPKSDPAVYKTSDEKEDPVFERIHRGSNWYWYVAAAVILVAGLFFYSQKKQISSDKTAQVADREISTSKGQRTSLILSDGTRITLNAESKLTIPKDYGNKARTIYLDGEAFFEVRHDADHPFTVVTKHAFIRDLGTKFNVTTYDSSQTVVAVSEGSVSMGRARKGTPQKKLAELSKNKLGVLEDIGPVTVSDISDINDYTGWTRGELVFRKTPFKEVVRRLERWYDIDCKVKDPQLYQRTLTATYDQMSMSEVLQVLSISIHASYSRQDTTIIFEDKK
ncbi:MAG TPA: FecR domain-containing protein [Balneolales bacterium]|nr:FecR domain-containing protein [Balneolales bacterium]